MKQDQKPLAFAGDQVCRWTFLRSMRSDCSYKHLFRVWIYH